MGKSYQLQIFLRLPKPFLFSNSLERQRKGNIFDGIHGSQKVVGLENKAHPFPPEGHQLILSHLFDMLSAYDNLSLSGLLQTCQHI